MSSKVLLSRGNNAREYLKALILTKQDFILSSSNYTTNIKTPSGGQKFVVNKMSKKTFAAASKVKADVIKHPIPKVDNTKLQYFQHDFRETSQFDSVINIDLRSAYATILFNDKYISKETFEYLQTCRKQERLAAIGMLASRKKVFEYIAGVPESVKEEISETSGMFFYLVRKTSEIMTELKKVCGDYYLFTWVDGIYFLPDKEITFQCMKVLQDTYFDFSIDQLENFNVRLKRTVVSVSFNKSDSYKTFNLPINPNEYQKKINEQLFYNKKKSRL